MITIGLASDHNGVELKQKMREFLNKNGIKAVDIGPFTTDKKVDYVDYANQLCQIINTKGVDKGILICGTGVGMSIAANRFDKIRAALVHNIMTAPRSREHNDSNILCLGAWTTTEEENFEILSLWLATSFGEGRHVKRIEKLSSVKEKIIFTNGVFDILHTGHLEIIRFAKSLGDKLIVGINSDNSVKQLKGPQRPINSQNDRKKLLEALTEVDEVVIFDELDTKKIISQISPSVVVKGGEWTAEEVRIRDKIPNTIAVKVCPFVDNYSTTNIIKKIYKKLDAK
jgi:ribose 5-phosphate isomerase B